MVLHDSFLFQVCERFSQGAYFLVVAFPRSSETSSIAPNSKFANCQVHSKFSGRGLVFQYASAPFSIHRPCLVNFWSIYMNTCTLKSTFYANFTAPASRSERHCGKPSCSKTTYVMNDVYLLKQMEQVQFWETSSIPGRFNRNCS